MKGCMCLVLNHMQCVVLCHDNYKRLVQSQDPRALELGDLRTALCLWPHGEPATISLHGARSPLPFLGSVTIHDRNTHRVAGFSEEWKELCNVESWAEYCGAGMCGRVLALW